MVNPLHHQHALPHITLLSRKITSHRCTEAILPPLAVVDHSIASLLPHPCVLPHLVLNHWATIPLFSRDVLHHHFQDRTVLAVRPGRNAPLPLLRKLNGNTLMTHTKGTPHSKMLRHSNVTKKTFRRKSSSQRMTNLQRNTIPQI